MKNKFIFQRDRKI